MASWREEHVARVMALEAAASTMLTDALADVLRPIATNLGKVTTAAATGPAEARVSMADLGALSSRWGMQVDDVVLPWFGGIFEAGGNAAQAQLAGIGVIVPHPDPELMNTAARNYLAHARPRFTRLGDEAWRHARQELVAGFQAGEGISALRGRVRRVEDLTRTEADRMARTEVIAASNAGAVANVELLGDDQPPFRQWLSTLDTRTRPTHVRADGQVVKSGDTFQVGTARLRFPGDPNGPRNEVERCRCTILFLDDPTPLEPEGRQVGGQDTASGPQEIGGTVDIVDQTTDVTPDEVPATVPAEVVDLVSDTTPAPPIPGPSEPVWDEDLRARIIAMDRDRNMPLAEAFRADRNNPQTPDRYGLSRYEDNPAPLHQLWADIRAGEATSADEWVDIDGAQILDPTVGPHQIRALMEDYPTDAYWQPVVLRLPDGTHVLVDNVEHAIAGAARNSGRFMARVYDVELPGPARRPVSAAVTGDDATSEAVARALAAIDKVHTDGDLTPTVIRHIADSDREPGVRGYYEPSLDDGIKAIRLDPDATDEDAASTLIHEIGHWLDFAAIDPASARGRYRYATTGSPLTKTDGTPFSPMGTVLNAIRDSDDYQAADKTRRYLRDMANNRGNSPRIRRQYRARADYADYLLSDVELWARAYAQYISIRSGDRRLISSINAQRKRYAHDLPGQWGWTSFEPIADAIDQLLRTIDWTPTP